MLAEVGEFCRVGAWFPQPPAPQHADGKARVKGQAGRLREQDPGAEDACTAQAGERVEEDTLAAKLLRMQGPWARDSGAKAHLFSGVPCSRLCGLRILWGPFCTSGW